MQTVAQEPVDWIDGFLFVANRPILDFLNTRPVLAQGPVELLPDVHALERWLIAAEILTSAKTKRLLRGWRNTPEATAFLADLLVFRERLRDAVLRMETDSAPSAEFLRDINAGLQRYPPKTGLRRREGQTIREVLFDPQQPADLWTPFFDGAADLLSQPETHRLRRCEACVIHFFDTSKKGSRRWCSMNICGNRLKVAAYQQRRRDNSTVR